MKKNKLLNLFLNFLIIIFLISRFFLLFSGSVLAGTCTCSDDRQSSQPDENACINDCGGNPYDAQYTEEAESPKTPEKGGAPSPISLTNPIAATTVPQLIGSIIKAVLGIVGALALAMFIYGGFMWLTSAGSPDKIKKGTDILTWAVVGLIVIFVSYALVDFVIKALGA